MAYLLTLRCSLLHAKPRSSFATSATSELHNVCFSIIRYFVACLLGSSAGLAYVMANGPGPAICTTVSSVVQA
jgi:hypothetical protein